MPLESVSATARWSAFRSTPMAPRRWSVTAGASIISVLTNTRQPWASRMQVVPDVDYAGVQPPPPGVQPLPAVGMGAPAVGLPGAGNGLVQISQAPEGGLEHPGILHHGLRVSLEGKVSGARESQLLHAETLKGLVRRAGRELASARKRGDRHGVHQKIRRLDNLRSRLARVEADRGIIPSFKTASGQRRYNVDAYLNQPPEIETVCYCRVSSHKQKDDIQRQILPMQEQFPHAAIITDVTSGLNWQRKGLVSILE